MQSLPIIDIKALINEDIDQIRVANEIGRACKEVGFFYIVGHGVDELLQKRLENLSRAFFQLDSTTKQKIHMSKGGKAWRGYFPVGEELTSGHPDQKEGLYFGDELPPNHPEVAIGIPLHGQNLFPEEIINFKETVLDYIEAIKRIGHVLMKALSMSLGLAPNFFNEYYTKDPLILFRIFHYPSLNSLENETQQWGVGEHTDYGVLTILKQDNVGGLQVKSNGEWIEAPPIPNSFICNIGDMLEKMTGGIYLSTPHRVRNISGKSRLSFPLFFDPNFNSIVKPLPFTNETLMNRKIDQYRWDEANVHTFSGTYGDYILNKISKVFPELIKTV